MRSTDIGRSRASAGHRYVRGIRDTKRNEKKKSSPRGFTLVEVLLAVAILGGLLATLLVTLNHHIDVAGDLERSLRLQDAADRFLEETLSAGSPEDGQKSGTIDPEGYAYTLRIQPAEEAAAYAGVRWLRLAVRDDTGGEVTLNLWIP